MPQTVSALRVIFSMPYMQCAFFTVCGRASLLVYMLAYGCVFAAKIPYQNSTTANDTKEIE